MTAASRNYRRLAVAATVLMAALYFVLQVYPLLKSAGGHANDFKHIYLGSYLLGEGANPYDAETLLETGRLFEHEDPRFDSGVLPYVYLPFTGLVMRPISMLAFPHAVIAWNLLNHLLLVLGLIIVARAANWTFDWKAALLIGSAVAFNYSLFRQNNAGQLNVILLFGYAVIYMGLVREWKPWLIGAIAAFLMMFKITPGILFLYFLLTKRYREAGWMALTACMMMLLTVLLYGIRIHLDFLPLLSDMGYGKSTWAELGHTFWRDPYNQSMNSFLHHLMVPWPGFNPPLALSPAAANIVTLVFALGVLLLLGIFLVTQKPATPSGIAGGYSMAILASLLIPSLMWDHYLIQALIPAILLWTAPPDEKAARVRAAIAACVAIHCLGVEFSRGFLHFGIVEQPLNFLLGEQVRLATIPFPAVPVVRELLMSLKLWPTIGLFIVAATACRGAANSAPKHPI